MPDLGLWPPGPRPPRLRPGEVHLWYGRLDDSATGHADLTASLSPDEAERAATFGDPELRRRYLVGRGILRALLGGYLDRPAGSIRLRYGDAGKPSLRNPISPLRFNLSHSGEHLLVGMAEGVELGVDIEEVRKVSRREAIARRVLTAEERATIARFGSRDRNLAFLIFWSGKEALAKACGQGIGALLGGMTGGVSANPLDLSSALRAIEQAGETYRCGALAPVPGCVGAVAICTEEPVVVRRWRLDPHLPIHGSP